MEYAIIHGYIDGEDFFGYTVLADELTYNTYKQMIKGELPPSTIWFNPFDENYVEGHLSIDPISDKHAEETEPTFKILYIFISDKSRVTFLTRDEWFNLNRTKKITDKLNHARIKKLAGIK